jgi:hypothetical protein
MAANFWKINRRQPEAISDNTLRFISFMAMGLHRDKNSLH